MLAIQQCSFPTLEAAPNFTALLEEYSAESALKGLPEPTLKMEQYRRLGNSKIFFPLGAYLCERLIGFAALLIPVIPHYGVSVAVTESIFVAKASRGTGAGLRIIREAERISREAGSPGLMITAGVGSSLAELLPRIGYEETNRVFFRKNPDA